MPPPSDRPGARTRAATLRIKRGAKTLSEIALGRAKLVVGGGATAQLRLKNAGLPDECIVLDTREPSFKLESRLGPDEVRVNGNAVESATVGPGDRIEFSGITLELIAVEAEARPDPAPARALANAPSAPEADPYMGRQTAARMRLGELEQAVAKLRGDRPVPGRNDPTDFDGPESRARRNEERERELPTRKHAPDPTDADVPRARTVEPARPAREAPSAPEREAPPPPARARVPTDHDARDERIQPTQPPQQRPPAAAAAEKVIARDAPSRPSARPKKSLILEAIEEMKPAAEEMPRAGFARPPWLEAVGDSATAGAKLYLLRAVVEVGRQSELRVNHPSVSKKHSRFTAKDGALYVEDLGSTNGTWVNRERLSAPRALVNGDTLHFGAAEFRIQIPVGAEESAPAESPRGEASATVEVSRMPFAPEDPPVVRGSAAGANNADRRSRPRIDPDSFPGNAVVAPATEREIPSEEVRRRIEAPLRPSAFTAREVPREARDDRNRAPVPRAPRRPIAEPPPPPPPLAPEIDDELPEPAPRAPGRTRGGPLDPPAYGHAPAKPAPRTRRELPIPTARKRTPVALFAAGMLVFAVAGGAGSWVAWPRVRALLSVPAKGEETVVRERRRPAPQPAPAANSPAGNTAMADLGSTSHATDSHPAGRTAATPAPAPTLVVVATVLPPAPTPASTRRPGQNLLDGEKLDIGGDNGRLNNELAALEQGPNNNRLRAERVINSDALESIYVDEGTATIRRFHPEDGFTMAPSAADDPNSEDRRVGAKQISGDRVNALIRGHFGEVKQCLVGGTFKGGRARVVVQFTIQPSGKVGESRVIESDVAGARFQSCVTGVVKRISFPKPKDQAVVVQFPFVFTMN